MVTCLATCSRADDFCDVLAVLTILLMPNAQRQVEEREALGSLDSNPERMLHLSLIHI